MTTAAPDNLTAPNVRNRANRFAINLVAVAAVTAIFAFKAAEVHKNDIAPTVKIADQRPGS